MSEKESEIFNVYRELEGIPAAPRGVALGVFDGVHRGHRHLIARMKEACAERHLRPCVFTFSYDTGFGFNDKKINHDFLMTDAEKLEVLESLGMRDVFLIPLTPDFCRLSADAFLSDVLMNKLSVKLLAIGEDGRFGAGRRGDARYLREFSRSGITYCSRSLLGRREGDELENPRGFAGRLRRRCLRDDGTTLPPFGSRRERQPPRFQNRFSDREH